MHQLLDIDFSKKKFRYAHIATKLLDYLKISNAL